MLEIPLTHGKVALIDDEDYELISKYKWKAILDNGNWYARARYWTYTPPKKRWIVMHRLVCPSIARIDHRDRNGLNNQKSNLRPATNQQNSANCKKQSGTASQYKGVRWRASRNHWAAVVQVDGEAHYLGSFHTEIEAALAYDAAAVKHFGEFARPNFPSNLSMVIK